MPPEPLTVKEAAIHLGITPRTVRLWIEAGRLRAERVQGKFGPEWRLDREEVLRAADRRTEQPLALDLAGKPGGNALRAIIALLDSELRKIQDQQQAHTRYMDTINRRLDELADLLRSSAPQSALSGLIHQAAQVQQNVEHLSRARHRQARELQAAVQALAAEVHEQAGNTARLADELASLRRRRLPWYRRLLPGRSE